MRDPRHRPSAHGFTLIEMLTVIAIIGIIAGLSLPVLKNFGKSDVAVSASRQLLDDIGYARQLAMAQRTTVYMVFVPTNFWTATSQPGMNLFLNSTLSAAQLGVATNLLGRQLTGYTYLAYGAVGDQPGAHQWHYLAPWQNLPNGAYIPLWKFYNAGNPANPLTFSDPVNANNYFSINAFSYTTNFPFPTQDATNQAFAIYLPYIAFNYLGQLSDYSGNLFAPQPNSGIGDSDFVGGGIDIPLQQGSVLPNINVNTKTLQPGPPQVTEVPVGNSTNISYTVVHIDPLTGRSSLEFHKMQ